MGTVHAREAAASSAAAAGPSLERINAQVKDLCADM